MPKRQPTLKQQGLIKALSGAKNLNDAAAKAGYYDKSTVSRALTNIRAKMPEALERVGVGHEWLANKCKLLAEAKETKHFAYNGIVMDKREVEALDIQLRTTEMIAKMHGAFSRNGDVKDSDPTGSITINLAIVDAGRASELLAFAESHSRPAVLDDAVHENAGRPGSEEPT